MLKRSLILIALGITLISCKQEHPVIVENARLFYLIGDVQVNGEPAQLNQILNNRDIIKTGEESSAEILIGKQTGAQIRANSLAVLVIEKDSWEIDTKKGAVLSIVETGRQYRVKSPTAVVAVRGTIFYSNTYEDSSHYICTCNGSVDIVYDGSTKPVSAAHHKGFSVAPGTSGKFIQPEGMKEHTDLEIFDFMYRLNQAQGKI